MQSRLYKEVFPETRLKSAKPKASDFATTAGGFRRASYVGGVLTDRGADFIIIDDPLKGVEAYSDVARHKVEEWFGRTLISRLNSKKHGAIILVVQRLHDDDLSGVLLRELGWRHLTLPAIAVTDERFEVPSFGMVRVLDRKKGEPLHEARESLEILQQLRSEQGDTAFQAQYQQNPLPASGNMVQVSWIKYYNPNELPTNFDVVFQSWDTANTATDRSDYSVCTTWGVKHKKNFLLNVFRERLDFPSLCQFAIQLRESYAASTVLIENKASGTQLLQELKHRGHYWVKPIEPEGDKKTRMHGQSVLIENGAVLLPAEAPWLTEYVRELTAFPYGKYYDQIDSTSQALAWSNPRDNVPVEIRYN